MTSRHLPVWQSEPCPSWCILADGGHDDADTVAERRHESGWATIDRPRLDAVCSPLPNSEWRLRRTGVRLEQHVQLGNNYAPMVRICTEDDDGMFPVPSPPAVTWALIVTASEALELAELIRRAACMAANEQLARPS